MYIISMLSYFFQRSVNQEKNMLVRVLFIICSIVIISTQGQIIKPGKCPTYEKVFKFIFKNRKCIMYIQYLLMKYQ